MKIAITSKGKWISSEFCRDFEKCEYLIIYDTLTNQYGSRKSPSFNTKNKADLIDFFKKTLIRNIITGDGVASNRLKIFTPSSKISTVEEAIMEFLKTKE